MLLVLFMSICNHEIFIKLNLPILLVLVGQREKSQKYFDLSTFNYNLNDSNPCSNLGVMNFHNWELFSGSPGIKLISCLNFFRLQCRQYQQCQLNMLTI